MPLNKSASKSAFKENIQREVEAGKPLKQALAISYSVQRKARTGRPPRRTLRNVLGENY